MNFKESYKKANDNIHGDKSILDKIYSPKRKIITPYFYKMTSLAAAFILVGTVFLMSSFKENVNKENDNIINEATSEKYKSTKEVEDLKIMAREATALEDEAKAENGKNEAASVIGSSDTAKTENISVLNDSIEYEDFYTEESVTADKEETEELKDESENKKVSAGGGGGGSSAAYMFSTQTILQDEEEKEISTLEALKLIGVSKEKLGFDNMELTLPETIKVTFKEDGNLDSFVINFTLSYNEAKIEGVLINSVTLVPLEIKEEEGAISAHKTFGSTDIFIKAYNMDKETVKTFIESFN